MASLTVLSSSSPWLSCGGGRHACIPSASLTFLAGSTRRSSVSLNVGSNPIPHSGLLHCSFIPSSSSSSSFSSSFSFPSSFSGLSLGLNLSYGNGVGREKARSLVVRARKFALCQTKRNRSRKSLARTQGFRRRMRTTSGRAILKRRRAKGQKVLCTKTNPNSGKRA